MMVTPTAKALTAAPDALPDLLAGYTDAMLDSVEAWAKDIAAGRPTRITNHTPRGYQLSRALGERVLKAVHAEQHKRCGL